MPVIPRRTHLRNIVVSTLAIALVLMMGLGQGFVPESVLAQQGTLTPTNSPQTTPPGQTATFNFTITNTSATVQTFTLTAPNPPSGLTPSFTVNNIVTNTVTVSTTTPSTFSMQVVVAANVTPTAYALSVIATGGGNVISTSVQLIVSNTAPTVTNTPSPTLSPTPQGNLTLSPQVQDVRVDINATATYTIRVTNTGGGTANVALTVSSTPSGVQILLSISQVTLGPGQSQDVTVTIATDINATAGPRSGVTISARDSNTGVTATHLLRINVTVNGATVTPTGTTTATVSPTPTTGPSLTATPPICRDSYEDDGDMGSAKEIQINLPQPSTSVDPQVPGHTICPEGDEDWLFFGGLAGKVYTIDVSEMALGLDLSLTLYDANGKQLAFNDDYYNRAQGTPDARAPGAAATGDIKPRIQSWTAPANGRYYIQVRDAAGSGRRRGAYTIQLLSESYGPTPTQDTQLCQDLFEPDGLPEQARLVGPNEIQPLHTFCPTGDADWIRFFGAQGKTYFIFTDTRPYASSSPRPPNAPVNPGENGNIPEAGADSIIYLTDRDGVSLLDFNDDIPGGSTLDSQIEFTPSVDGFYFLQVKNRGDLGNQFIRYDLTVQLCLPGQTNCGRPNATPAPPTVPANPAGETTQTPEFNLDQTTTPTPTGTVQASDGTGGATLASNHAPVVGFVEPALPVAVAVR